MLQSNLIYGIQKKIKENRTVGSSNGFIEESSVEEVSADAIEREMGVEPILESSFISGIYEKAAGAKKKETVRKTLVTESFNLNKAEKKLNKDFVYFNYLYENFVSDPFKDQYSSLLESIFSDVVKLYEECDITPRLFSQAVDVVDLTENQIVDIYRNGLNQTIKNNYTKPLLSGKITEIYESEIRDLTKKLIHEGSEIDMEQVKIYLPFEECLNNFNTNVLIPETARKPIETFIESMTSEYSELLQESPEDILQHIEKKLDY
jgi:hypothetical protein